MAPVQDTYPLVPGLAFPGMLYDAGVVDVVTGVNVHATLGIRFGYAVAQAATGSDKACEPVEAILDIIRGILIRSIAYAPSELNSDDEVLPKATLNILRKGRIWVICENGCTRGQRGHVRAIVAGAEVRGALRSAADGTDTKDCSGQIEFVTSASAGALAVAEVDFTNLPT